MTAYQLSKWSHYVRIRDGHKCVMCEEDASKQSGTVTRRGMHAHHIDEKHLEPDKALKLNNGVCVCSRCHLEIVHTSATSPRKFRALFVRHVRHVGPRRFAAKYQHRLDP